MRICDVDSWLQRRLSCLYSNRLDVLVNVFLSRRFAHGQFEASSADIAKVIQSIFRSSKRSPPIFVIRKGRPWVHPLMFLMLHALYIFLLFGVFEWVSNHFRFQSFPDKTDSRFVEPAVNASVRRWIWRLMGRWECSSEIHQKPNCPAPQFVNFGGD